MPKSLENKRSAGRLTLPTRPWRSMRIAAHPVRSNVRISFSALFREIFSEILTIFATRRPSSAMHCIDPQGQMVRCSGKKACTSSDPPWKRYHRPIEGSPLAWRSLDESANALFLVGEELGLSDRLGSLGEQKDRRAARTPVEPVSRFRSQSSSIFRTPSRTHHTKLPIGQLMRQKIMQA